MCSSSMISGVAFAAGRFVLLVNVCCDLGLCVGFELADRV